jgi:hypothetical protein
MHSKAQIIPLISYLYGIVSVVFLEDEVLITSYCRITTNYIVRDNELSE